MAKEIVPTSSPDPASGREVLLGAVVLGALGAVRTGRLVGRTASPAFRLLLDPPLVPRRLRPRNAWQALGAHGRLQAQVTRAAAARALTTLAPLLVDRALRLVPVTELVREHLDLDALVASVDLDAVLRRVDLDAVVASVDLDAVLERVDLDALVASVDLDAVVRRIDLTALVTEQVDLDAVAASLDLDALIERIDLAALARDVMVAVDLPEIIRESSGSLVNESVRGVRLQSIDADRAVEGLVHRLLRRHAEQEPDRTPEQDR